MTSRDSQHRCPPAILGTAALILSLVAIPLRAAEPVSSTESDHAQTLKSQLSDEDRDIRRAAARTISLLPDADAVEPFLPDLIERLKEDQDQQVALYSINACTTLGPKALPAFDALIDVLTGQREDWRYNERANMSFRVFLTIGKMGPGAVEPLAEVFNSDSRRLRAGAVFAAAELARNGTEITTLLPHLLDALASRDDELRSDARDALVFLGEPAVLPLLTTFTTGESPAREEAVRALGELQEERPEVQAALLAAAADEDLAVKVAAIGSLGRGFIDSEMTLPILRDAITSPDADVRYALLNTLATSAGLRENLIPELQNALTNDNVDIARDAAELLRREKAVTEFLAAMETPNAQIEVIAEALGGIGPAAMGAIHAELNSSSAEVRRGCLLAMGHLRPVTSENINAMMAGLNDNDSAVVRASLMALRNVGSEGRDAVPIVREQLRSGESDDPQLLIDTLFQIAPRDEELLADSLYLLETGTAELRQAALRSILSLGTLGRKAIPELANALSDDNLDVRLAAAETISAQGRFAGAAVSALRECLTADSHQLRASAVSALGKIGEDAEPVFDDVVALLADDHPGTRRETIYAMSSISSDGDRVRPHLKRALTDKDEEVRDAALSSIRRMRRDAGRFIPDLISLVGSSDSNRPDDDDLERTLSRLTRIGADPDVLPELVDLLSSEITAQQRFAVNFLGLAGPDAQMAIEPLEALSQHENEELRTAVNEALEAIRNTEAQQ